MADLPPFSLTDFPGKIAAIVFTQGCNFRCPFCHNGRLIPKASNEPEQKSASEIFEWLEDRRGKLDGVVLSGGEPTLQNRLIPFAARLKQLGYAVKLDTNGSHPDVIREMLDSQLLDFIAMDIKASWERYNRLAGVPVNANALAESIDLIAQSGIEHEFRTTTVWPMLSEEDIDRLKRLVPPGSPHRLQPFQPEHAMASWLRRDEAHQTIQEDASASKGKGPHFNKHASHSH